MPPYLDSPTIEYSYLVKDEYESSETKRGSKSVHNCSRVWYLVGLVALLLVSVVLVQSGSNTLRRSRQSVGTFDGLEDFLGPIVPKEDGYEDGFTIVTPTYKREELLPEFLKLYGSGDIPHLRQIILLWMDQEMEAPEWLVESLATYAVPITIKKSLRNSMNERFRPNPDIETSCVLSIDDDVRLDPVDVELGYQAWVNFGEGRKRMVGYTARGVSDALKYVTKRMPTYSMVLAKNAFFHVDWYKGFWSDEMAELREYIDEGHYCEDILMSFLVARKSRLAPLAFNAKFGDLGQTNGISTKPSHYPRRTKCVQHFLEVMGEDTLIESSLEIMRRV